MSRIATINTDKSRVGTVSRSVPPRGWRCSKPHARRHVDTRASFVFDARDNKQKGSYARPNGANACKSTPVSSSFSCDVLCRTSDMQVVDRVGVPRRRERCSLNRQGLGSSVPNHHLIREPRGNDDIVPQTNQTREQQRRRQVSMAYLQPITRSMLHLTLHRQTCSRVSKKHPEVLIYPKNASHSGLVFQSNTSTMLYRYFSSARFLEGHLSVCQTHSDCTPALG